MIINAGQLLMVIDKCNTYKVHVVTRLALLCLEIL